ADEDMQLLSARTEGWIAGMQLAALAMRQRADRSAFVQAFTGSQRYLMDYIQEEILDRQPLRVQRFLLQTALLTRLNAAVCTALTAERASQAVLEWLERNNLFVVPLDEQGRSRLRRCRRASRARCRGSLAERRDGDLIPLGHGAARCAGARARPPGADGRAVSAEFRRSKRRGAASQSANPGGADDGAGRSRPTAAGRWRRAGRDRNRAALPAAAPAAWLVCCVRGICESRPRPDAQHLAADAGSADRRRCALADDSTRRHGQSA